MRERHGASDRRRRAWTFVLVLLAALGTMAPTCSFLSYKSDVEKVCDAEHASGISAAGNGAALIAWLGKNVATPEGVVLINELATKGPRDRAVQLRNEARKLSMAACPLADTFEAQARDDDVKQDMINLCAQRAVLDTGTAALLDITSAPDDAERLREIREWAASNARTPTLGPVVDKLGQAAPRDRGKVLRGEASKLAVSPCVLADALDRPPPAPIKLAPTILPTFAITKYEGSRKFATIVSDVVAGNGDIINACYAVGLAKVPTLTGKATARVTLDSNGKVTGAKDDGSTLSDHKVVKCVIDAFANASYPKIPDKGGEKFTVTLTFSTTSSIGTPPQTQIAPPKK
jgi:hypothetical protein